MGRVICTVTNEDLACHPQELRARDRATVALRGDFVACGAAQARLDRDTAGEPVYEQMAKANQRELDAKKERERSSDAEAYRQLVQAVEKGKSLSGIDFKAAVRHQERKLSRPRVDSPQTVLAKKVGKE